MAHKLWWASELSAGLAATAASEAKATTQRFGIPLPQPGNPSSLTSCFGSRCFSLHKLFANTVFAVSTPLTLLIRNLANFGVLLFWTSWRVNMMFTLAVVAARSGLPTQCAWTGCQRLLPHSWFRLGCCGVPWQAMQILSHAGWLALMLGDFASFASKLHTQSQDGSSEAPGEPELPVLSILSREQPLSLIYV